MPKSILNLSKIFPINKVIDLLILIGLLSLTGCYSVYVPVIDTKVSTGSSTEIIFDSISYDACAVRVLDKIGECIEAKNNDMLFGDASLSRICEKRLNWVGGELTQMKVEDLCEELFEGEIQGILKHVRR